MAAQLTPETAGLNPTSKGYKTTEFYITLISQVIGLLVLSGRIDPQQSQFLNDFFVQAIKVVMDIGALGYMLYTAYAYIKGRNDLKQAVIAASVTPEPIQSLPVEVGVSQ